MRQVKGQVIGIVVYFLSIVIVLVLLAFAFGGLFSVWGAQAIANGHLTGFEAFLWGNLNLWVILCMIIGLLAVAYVGTRQ